MRLNVHLDFGAGADPVALGRLGRDEASRTVVFEWNKGFAGNPLHISPLIERNYYTLLEANKARGATLPGLFEDSLPDGWGRLLLDREMEARGISRAGIGDLERLAYVGRHGAGALTYQPDTDRDPIGALDLAWFEEIIPQVGAGASAEDLSRLRVISGGSQGARPKFVAQLHEDMRSLRDHRADPGPGWCHVLIKGRASSDPHGVVEAEIAYGRLMRHAGITTSPMFALAGASEAFFATERFDRPGQGRLHMATVAGMLDIGMVHGAVDYVDLIKIARAIGGGMTEVEEVFRRMVFNIRAFNRDDHVRNHAYLMDAAGRWSLAPAYDVSFSDGPGGEHSLAVAGEGRRPGVKAIFEVARLSGIKPARRNAIIEAVDAALDEWGEVARDFGVPDRLRAQIGREIQTARSWA
ncbi:type II toxin-antitoxin system HipA family toxin [Pseudomonas sp. GX19020]|uniref:type II toxin-antitoxin system HipA family toxin n=1 Tax=Pseudomonas sp. GX19020 TaxID=2942277 RepID=UPI0020193B7E|nr:type II toxin-antitoxin system HipA family toxin [Pseudomonas sp. GX19020]MCL4068928.1 type II toxin-antitoxin system HipA family toxin [Pseudomonas sp. GX19020]